MKGGTWLGITKSGRLATVTNLRQSNSSPPKSRGKEVSPYSVSQTPTCALGALVVDFLKDDELSPMEYAKKVAVEEDDYDGFNLLLVDIK